MTTITLFLPGYGANEFSGETNELIGSIFRRFKPENIGNTHQFFPMDFYLPSIFTSYAEQSIILDAMTFIKNRDHFENLNIILIGQSLGASYCHVIANEIQNDNELIQPNVTVISIDPANPYVTFGVSNIYKIADLPNDMKTLPKCVKKFYGFYAAHDCVMSSFIPQMHESTETKIMSFAVDHVGIVGLKVSRIFRGLFAKSSGGSNVHFCRPFTDGDIRKNIRDTLEKYIIAILYLKSADLYICNNNNKITKLTDSDRLNVMRAHDDDTAERYRNYLFRYMFRIRRAPKSFRVEGFVEENQDINSLDNPYRIFYNATDQILRYALSDPNDAQDRLYDFRRDGTPKLVNPTIDIGQQLYGKDVYNQLSRHCKYIRNLLLRKVVPASGGMLAAAASMMYYLYM